MISRALMMGRVTLALKASHRAECASPKPGMSESGKRLLWNWHKGVEWEGVMCTSTLFPFTQCAIAINQLQKVAIHDALSKLSTLEATSQHAPALHTHKITAGCMQHSKLQHAALFYRLRYSSQVE